LDDYRKPRWWKRNLRSFWLTVVILPFVLILAVLGVLFLQGLMTLTDLLKYAVITSLFIATGYYIRRQSSLKFCRMMWILYGVCSIGILTSAVLLGVFGRTLVLLLGQGPAFLLSLGISIALGVLVGDNIGKRRDYRPLR
jgi:hypothetical protein